MASITFHSISSVGVVSPAPPRGFSAQVRRIWKIFTDFLKSCLNCFGIFSTTRAPLAERDLRLISDPGQIAARLSSQMQCALEQMHSEPMKAFQYETAPATWDRHMERVGGFQVGVSHAQGRRPTMEDEHLALSFDLRVSGRSYPLQLFGVFDGHGGNVAAQYVRDHLAGKLQEALLEFNAQGLSDAGIWKALKMTTVRMHREFREGFGQVARRQGTTATIAMILDNKLWTANVGDARTVLDNNGTAMQLTEDAKPADLRYRRDIEARGGRVEFNGCPRINGDLAVARAIGDHRLGEAISPRPKITVLPMDQVQRGSHLILCCDGVYDVARTQDVVAAVHANRALSPDVLSGNITYSAYQSGSNDNLSCLVIPIG